MSKNKTPKSDARENTAITWVTQHERHSHSAEEALWAPLSPAERRPWSQALVDFRPAPTTPMTYRMLDSMMQRTGVLTFERWVQPILAFDRAGFSAQNWLEIMTSLHVLLARQPDLVLNNPAVTMLGDHHLTSRVEIQPGSWLAWLPLRRSGKSALAATRAVLLTTDPATVQAARTRLRAYEAMHEEVGMPSMRSSRSKGNS